MVLQEKMHFDNLIKYYEKRNMKFLNYRIRVDHDGYDMYGPKSNIYYLMVIYKKEDNYNFYVDFWCREYWFSDDLDDEPYEKVKYPEIFYNNVFRNYLKNQIHLNN
jgi:hypothetical protein